ncbi:MAG TPA: hypothetical protein DDY25_08295, partial [Peptococcaceae bacterium]|nr:hypothetical protein [Peptococcaceae bacterium]
FPQHQRIVTTVGGVETVTYSCGGSCPITPGADGDIDAAHIAAYNGLLAQANAAQAAVNNSLKSHYDAYDTKAVAKLKRLADSASEGIMIKVVGSQTAPE